MRARRGLGVGVLLATGLLLAATVGLASLPPRPLRSALTVLHTLTFRIATDWLAVVALLAVAGRCVRADARITGTTVAALAVAVFLGGVAIEASPLARLVAAPASVDSASLVRGLGVAVQRALYPAGLVLAVVAGAAASEPSAPFRANATGLPLAPSGGRGTVLPRRAVVWVLGVFGAVSAVALSVDVAARLAVGVDYLWLAAVDASVAAVGAGVGYAVLAGAFLVLAMEGATPWSLAGTTAAVWLTLALAGVAGGVLTAGLGVALVGVAGTPMPAVDAAGLGRWPAPHSWATLLRLGTLVAGGVGLLAVQRSAGRARPSDRGPAPGRAGETGVTRTSETETPTPGTGTGSGAGTVPGDGARTGGSAGTGSDPASANAGER